VAEEERLPNYERAIIPVAKTRDYLLATEHPVGRSKARFFASLGYTRNGWAALERALREQHLVAAAIVVERSKFGAKFAIIEVIKGPNGKAAKVRSIWLLRKGEEVPRFVTAYPAT
jgi:hypothetical protein